jgi:hypothetical protein
MPRSLAPTLALAALLASAPACTTPPKEAHDGATAPAPSSSSSSPASASALAPASAPASCTTDADCRLFSSYCEEAPCACRALLSRDPSPTCLGNAAPKVRCFADPCMKKAAHCQSGACVLTAK